MYVFVKVANIICLHIASFCSVQLHPRGREAVSELAFNLVKMYLSKLTNVFVTVVNFICLHIAYDFVVYNYIQEGGGCFRISIQFG